MLSLAQLLKFMLGHGGVRDVVGFGKAGCLISDLGES